MRWVIDELRAAWRALLASPGFSLLVMSVLAGSLACVMYMFAIINGLILRPLPFPDAENLYQVGVTEKSDLDDVNSVPAEYFADYKRRYGEAAEIAGIYQATVNLSEGGRPERFQGAFATFNLFPLLGAKPLLGRTFTADDDRPGAPLTVLLSDELWRSRYNADPAVIGRQVRVNTQPATVVGVMAPRFTFPEQEVVWLPSRLDEATVADSDNYYQVIARVRPGHAVAELEALHGAWYQEKLRAQPTAWQGVVPMTMPLVDVFMDQQTRGLLNIMFAATVLVLLIGSANAANLFLVRVLGRRQELAVRAALGASRRRLVLNVLAQAVTLSAVAMVVALPLAQYFVHATFDSFATTGDGPPGWMHFDIDATIVAFAAAAAFFTAVLVGLMPAWRSGADMQTAMRDGNRGSTGGGFARISRVLVVAEIALSCVLLISATVLVRIVDSMNRTDMGISAPEQLLTARIALFPEAYPTAESQLKVFRDLRERVRGDAVVIDAAAGDSLPGLDSGDEIIAPDGFVPGENGYPYAQVGSVDERYMDTYGMKLIEGRGLRESDSATSDLVTVVDSQFAQVYFPGQTAIGKRVRFSPAEPDGRTFTIVGVVSDLQLEDVDDPNEPSMLVPLAQNPQRFVTMAVRVRGDPAAYAPRLAEHMRAIDADTPLYWVRTYDRIIELATFGVRIIGKIFGVFGALALLLAVAGLYGVIAYNVGARTREIGVRRALGAPDTRVVRSVLGRSVWQVAMGIVIGLALGVPFAALLGKLLAQPGIDPVAIAATMTVLVVAAAIAAILPTLRALRVDPIVALRYE